jgi:hypothetical protein
MTDSDKVQEKSLADVNNVNALGASNYDAGMTIFRYFDTVTGPRTRQATPCSLRRRPRAPPLHLRA